jgi:hypothetical protein
MKTKIIIGGLLILTLIAIGVKANSIAYRVESSQIYSTSQEIANVQTHKFIDGKVTCYLSVAKNNNIVTSQSLSCVK